MSNARSRSSLRAFTRLAQQTRPRFPVRRLGLLLPVLLAAYLPAAAQTVPQGVSAEFRTAPRSLVTQPIDRSRLVPTLGAVHSEVSASRDLGPRDPSLRMEHIQLILQRPAERQAAFDALVDALHQPGNPSFHHWLTPETIGAEFGPSPSDIASLTGYLQSEGFTVNNVGKSGLYVDFTGTVAQVQQSFHTQIHNLTLPTGEQRYSAVAPAQLPEALAPLVTGFVALGDIGPKSSLVYPVPAPRSPAAGAANGIGIAPADASNYEGYNIGAQDFYTIYNENPLLASSINGSGVTIALLERSDINTADLTTFRTDMAISPATPNLTVMHGSASVSCSDPGIVSGDETEAVLDAEWAGATAPGATLLFMSCASGSNDGVLLSSEAVIDNNLAQVMSLSYGITEAVGSSYEAFVSNLWEQAAAQGETVVVSSGDQGAANTEDINEAARYGVAVNALASSAYNVAAGGTDFQDYLNNNYGDPSFGFSHYWRSTNNPGLSSALSYVPETTWNGTCASSMLSFYYTLDSSSPTALCDEGEISSYTTGGGGGVSVLNPRPSWQTGTVYGLPIASGTNNFRLLPDLSLFASNGYMEHALDFYNSTLSTSIESAGGTSFVAPQLAGVFALVMQKTGERLGQPDYVLYSLAGQEFGTASYTPGTTCNGSGASGTGLTATTPSNSCIFYDVQTGNISQPCVPGTPNCYSDKAGIGILSTSTTSPLPAYPAAAGYDLATGIGSLNIANLVNNWGITASATSLLSSVNPVASGQPVTFTATVSSNGSLTTTPTGSVTFYDSTTSLGTITLNGSGIATLTTSSLSVASHTITAAYGGDTNYGPSTSGPVIEVVTLPSAATPTFSPVAGTYTSPQTVTISSTPGVPIFYTTDGSTPTQYSFLYTGPVAVTSSETINAVADGAGYVYNNSNPGTAAYVINNVLSVISTYAGNGTAGFSGDGGTATSAEMFSPWDSALDSSGNLYIADYNNQRIRKVTPAGVISTFAGTGTAGYNGDGGSAINAELNYPTGVAFDASGNLYISDNGNSRIRKVTPEGVISTYAGNGTAGYSGDGSAAISAEINNARDIVVDNSGNLYIADLGNNRIRKVTVVGAISTVAGNGTEGYSGDGGAATSAELSSPISVTLDGSGNLYIGDNGNARVRKVTTAGIISTYAGNGTHGYSGDGGLATSAELENPIGIAVDSSGNLYVADAFAEVIRKVTSADIISTVAGNGAGGAFGGYGGDGGVATSAELGNPIGVTVDSSGNLYIADAANNRIRKVTYQTAFVTATTVASSQNPSTSGQSVTLTATVSSNNGPPPNGESVYFFNNGKALNTSPALLSGGTATFTTSTLPLGTDPITATYGGDSTYLPSTGSLSQVVSAGTPPQLGYLAYWAINNTGITVSWSTNVPANTQLAYGTTPSLGQLSPVQTALTASHGVVLTTLNPGTTYYFVAQSTGANGVTGYSTQYSFTTTGTAPAGPPNISNVAVGNITSTSATITWTTDQASTSQVNYGATTAYGLQSPLNSTLQTSQSVTLTGLTPGTTYDFDVVSANASAQSSTSTNASFTTSSATSPPAISNVATTNLTSTSVTVTWTTDQPSSSLVNYGTTTSYGSSSTLNTALVTAHSVVLTGLTASTLYDFDVVSANATSQSTTSPNSTFTTPASNATPPSVGYVAYWGINNTGITVSWSTDVPANTQLAYGTTTALGQLSPLQTALTASHGVVLTTLNPGTTYYFVAQSTGANGATGYSTTYSFTTTGTQTSPPPVISNVLATSAGNTSETITWTTDQAASSQVNYGLTTTYTNSSTLNPALLTTHTVTLTGLTPGTAYDFDVMSANSSAVSATSPNSTFTTTGTAPAPVITNVGSSSVTSSTATVSWTTDQASTSVVNYGPTTGYGSTASSAGLVTAHSVMLTGLTPNTIYDFNVVSANAANTSTTSGNYTFTTSSNSAPPPVISYLNDWGITSSGITISWSTNEPANTAVAYGTTNALGQLSPVQTALTDSHGVTLTGLAAGTTYYFAAQSADGSGNTGYSTISSFTTLAGPPTISNVVANPAANHTATVSWTTSAPTYSYVQFGTAAGSYGYYSALTALTATPSCALSYVPSGTVHYQLVSTDANGNQTASPDMTFTEP